MAAFSGSHEPDFSKVKVGEEKNIIDQELGEPIEKFDEQSFLYQYKLGDKPAPLRGVMHGVLDLCTFFLWEYIGFPLEISNSGNSYKMRVDYNNQLKVQEIKKIE